MAHRLGSESESHGYKQLTQSQRNADLELDKTGFRGNKENKERVCNIQKRHRVHKIWHFHGAADQ